MRYAIVSGGFDPLHSGHINYITSARIASDGVIVLLNSDEWLIKKKGKCFLPFEERKAIMESLKGVHEVIGFKDDELGSCINGLEEVKYRHPFSTLTFFNGGDRTEINIPEMQVEGINFSFGCGGPKTNSSSSILREWDNG